jgi:hypothetical protein
MDRTEFIEKYAELIKRTRYCSTLSLEDDKKLIGENKNT